MAISARERGIWDDYADAYQEDTLRIMRGLQNKAPDYKTDPYEIIGWFKGSYPSDFYQITSLMLRRLGESQANTAVMPERTTLLPDRTRTSMARTYAEFVEQESDRTVQAFNNRLDAWFDLIEYLRIKPDYMPNPYPNMKNPYLVYNVEPGTVPINRATSAVVYPEFDRSKLTPISDQSEPTPFKGGQTKVPQPSQGIPSIPLAPTGGEIIDKRVNMPTNTTSSEYQCEIQAGENCLLAPVPDPVIVSQIENIGDTTAGSDQLDLSDYEGAKLCELEFSMYIEWSNLTVPTESQMQQFRQQLMSTMSVKLFIDGQYPVPGYQNTPFRDVMWSPGCCGEDLSLCIGCTIPKRLNFLLINYTSLTTEPVSLPPFVANIGYTVIAKMSYCDCDCKKSNCGCS